MLLGKRSKQWLFLCKGFPICFLATDFNTGTITVTLQISLHYSTHKVFTGRLLILLQLRTFRGTLLLRTDWLVVSTVFKITPLHGLHGNHCLLFVKDACLQLRCLAIDVLLFRAFAWCGPHRKQFPLYCCHVLKGHFYRPSQSNSSSSIVACIRCRENVYGHSSIVT
jgi:hypothetical protein